MKHVVALSGGKDSTAMALRLAEIEPRDYVYVITPTGNELPEMFAHWRHLQEMLGKPMIPIMSGRKSLQGLIREQNALPNHRARWCTRKLKLEPYYTWLSKQSPCVSYVGLRADEQSRPGMIFPDTDGVRMDFPMRRWGWAIDDVLAYLRTKNISIPDRTDCAMCFWQKIGEWYLLWKNNREQYLEAEELEEGVIASRGKTVTLRSPQRDSWPAKLKDLRAEFENGRVPERSLKMMDTRRQSGRCRVCTL
ncbi:phosphoadenosine phosphosulfate reductase family protein [uncultured Cohaesibacter sp.]|uniref:phosphoadenosine phosphosulfate reductase family protein n=1 Tax=uncultured Cohaesibacter sp. TaxID=1002546 RepID=UPI002AABD5E8|nr:phosphoadenosine phosphosulfate reductase family protein [uncultured Cohaesibacter sp.]